MFTRIDSAVWELSVLQRWLRTAFGGRRCMGNVGLLLKGNQEEKNTKAQREREREHSESVPQEPQRGIFHMTTQQQLKGTTSRRKVTRFGHEH